MNKPLNVMWKEGARVKCSAEDAWTALEKVRIKNHGELSPSAVVAAARSKRNPLHDEFEWDDSIAAEKHREEQARSIIRSLKVTLVERPETEVRAYHVTVVPKIEEGEKPRQVYKTTNDILADPEARERLLARAISDLASFRQRYFALHELAEVFKAAEQAFKKYAS